MRGPRIQEIGENGEITDLEINTNQTELALKLDQMMEQTQRLFPGMPTFQLLDPSLQLARIVNHQPLNPFPLSIPIGLPGLEFMRRGVLSDAQVEINIIRDGGMHIINISGTSTPYS